MQTRFLRLRAPPLSVAPSLHTIIAGLPLGALRQGFSPNRSTTLAQPSPLLVVSELLRDTWTVVALHYVERQIYSSGETGRRRNVTVVDEANAAHEVHLWEALLEVIVSVAIRSRALTI